VLCSFEIVSFETLGEPTVDRNRVKVLRRETEPLRDPNYTLKPAAFRYYRSLEHPDRRAHQTVAPGRRLVFELGGLNRRCHIWAYKDAGERFAVRERARNEGGWPPRGGQPGATLKQENMLVVPASFSRLH